MLIMGSVLYVNYTSGKLGVRGEEAHQHSNAQQWVGQDSRSHKQLTNLFIFFKLSFKFTALAISSNSNYSIYQLKRFRLPWLKKIGALLYSVLYCAKMKEEEKVWFLCCYTEKCILRSSQYWAVPFSHMECTRAGGGKEWVGDKACST